MNNHRHLTSIAALVTLMTAPLGHSANLIINGSFEQPDILTTDSLAVFFPGSTALTGWSSPGLTIIHHAPYAGIEKNPTYNFAQDGDQYLDLSGIGVDSRIYQDFATTPSVSYQLSFYIGASNNNPPAGTIGVDVIGNTSLVSAALTPSAPGTHINWTLQTFTFVADSTTTRLQFDGLSGYDDNASFVDNISVTSIPEPSSAILVLSALGLALRRRR